VLGYRRQASRRLSPSFAVRVLLGLGVVLVVINLVALQVLLMLHLVVLLTRQLAAICRALGAHLVMDPRFVALDVRSLALRELASL
jgi:hypothetical protein